MIRINENYKKLQASYLFSDIAKRVAAFQKENPGREVIKMGIGDVTLPLADVCIKAFHRGVDDLADKATFKGYGPEQGYDFLRSAIAEHDYQSRNANISADEVFVSDGAKCDTGNFQELFASDAVIAVPDPVYPVYVDTNVMAGRSGDWKGGRYSRFIYLDSTEANNYVPDLPKEKADVIYLCFPNNPTGATATKEQLKKWVDYAKENKSLILFDAAYECLMQPMSALSATRSCRRLFSRFQEPTRWLWSSAASQRLPDSPVCGAVSPLCLKSAKYMMQMATLLHSTPCGTDGTPPSSTAPPTLYSAPQLPALHPRGRHRSRKRPTTTWVTQPLSRRPWWSWATAAPAATTRHMYGSTQRPIPGPSSTPCSTSAALYAHREAASAAADRAMCGSAPSTPGRTPRRPWTSWSSSLNKEQR